MTITITGEALKILDQFIYASEVDPETMADTLGYDPDRLITAMVQLNEAVTNGRKK